MSNTLACRRPLVCLMSTLVAAAVLLACQRAPGDRLQGYVEGEFVYVASPFPGALESLMVRRGAYVNAGEALFALERVAEKTTRDEAERRLGQALANLEDAKKGKRPTELESLKAQLKQSQAALRLSRLPVLAAAAMRPTSVTARSCAALNLACSLQISGLARVSPLSLPGTKAAQGSVETSLMTSAWRAAAAASNGARPVAMAPSAP